jgi:hypothetical protein
VHGARAYLRVVDKKTEAKSVWAPLRRADIYSVAIKNAEQ